VADIGRQCVLGLTTIRELAAMLSQERPKTGKKTSMPPRGSTPGLKIGRPPLRYWIARQVVRDTMGFPDKCIALPVGADMETVAALCQGHTARLMLWIGEHNPLAETEKTTYDGTVYSACQQYQKHPYSRFRTVKDNTRKSYTDSLKVIEATVGARLIRNLTILDVQHWYNEWRKPAAPGRKERIDRAHDAIAMFKMVLRFCAALRHKDCKQLIEDLENATSIVRFEKGGPREEQMTYEQASAFINAALDLGRREVIPTDRALYMAIGVAAQFETLLRQKDIIGEYHDNSTDTGRAIGKGAHHIVVGAETWTGWFAWERVPGWRWRLKTSKSNYRKSAEYLLSRYSLLLMPLLDQVPREQRVGAIVKGERGLPVRERSYRKWYREIAQVAGIPNAVWNMDSRAGGATEAKASGAPIKAIQGAMTHADEITTHRYFRDGGGDTDIATVADARARKRAADSSGGGDAGA
jgi:hypothetical protein